MFWSYEMGLTYFVDAVGRTFILPVDGFSHLPTYNPRPPFFNGPNPETWRAFEAETIYLIKLGIYSTTVSFGMLFFKIVWFLATFLHNPLLWFYAFCLCLSANLPYHVFSYWLKKRSLAGMIFDNFVRDFDVGFVRSSCKDIFGWSFGCPLTIQFL